MGWRPQAERAESIRRSRTPKRAPPQFPSFDMGEPRVNIDDCGQLREVMAKPLKAEQAIAFMEALIAVGEVGFNPLR